MSIPKISESDSIFEDESPISFCGSKCKFIILNEIHNDCGKFFDFDDQI